MDILRSIESKQMKDGAENFSVGDTVKVYFTIKEGDKERIQIYEGLVITFKNGGIRKTFTVRKNSYGVGVERIFPLHSPRIEKVEVVRKGRVKEPNSITSEAKLVKLQKYRHLLQKRTNFIIKPMRGRSLTWPSFLVFIIRCNSNIYNVVLDLLLNRWIIDGKQRAAKLF